MKTVVSITTQFLLGLAFFIGIIQEKLVSVSNWIRDNEDEILIHYYLFCDSVVVGVKNIYTFGQLAKNSYNDVLIPKVNKQLVVFGLKVPN